MNSPPILVYLSGDWDVHWGITGVLTHGHMGVSCFRGPQTWLGVETWFPLPKRKTDPDAPQPSARSRDPTFLGASERHSRDPANSTARQEHQTPSPWRKREEHPILLCLDIQRLNPALGQKHLQHKCLRPWNFRVLLRKSSSWCPVNRIRKDRKGFFMRKLPKNNPAALVSPAGFWPSSRLFYFQSSS